MEQPFLFGSVWNEIRDGNPTAMALFSRHYTFRRNRKIYQFCGPGEKLVLLTTDAKALFVWRKFISDAGEDGVNCAVFRNEGSKAGRSSQLIEDAVRIAWERWPGERLYTYVDAAKVASENPGYCFLAAGWERCGTTKGGKLILERRPHRCGKKGKWKRKQPRNTTRLSIL